MTTYYIKAYQNDLGHLCFKYYETGAIRNVPYELNCLLHELAKTSLNSTFIMPTGRPIYKLKPHQQSKTSTVFSGNEYIIFWDEIIQ